MSKFRVAFDGRWQEDFEDLQDALEWAQEVSETGRVAWVVERRGIRLRLKAVFPEDRAKEAEEEWKRQRRNSLVDAIAAGANQGG